MIFYILLVLVCIGLLFNLLAVVGLFRFPDVYTRLHAATKCTTFGTIFICIASIVFCVSLACTKGSYGIALHALVALVAILLTNPTGAHAISQASYKSGYKPVNAVVDKLAKVKQGDAK